ncbi:MAG TPA: mechanosensitive ion channel domain-containing protein [Frateuria sp.]|uniref:mechanosensitive ion channel family protein n=1 Tax=Frateuria sp. TaxID=2211372 RepID=UPI002D7F3302|nr:mechanosensitive ion channel domain-containing protein [Frateuria sp.]HET6804317.1 mechanosensitive ion channel domain-containing protein [Frateuria sp.]
MGRPAALTAAAPVHAPEPSGLAGWLDWSVAVGGMRLTLASLLAAVLVLALFLVGSALVRRGLNRYGQTHQGINPSSLYTVERLVHYLLLVIGVLWALSVAGVPVAKMTVFAGAIGVGLGFGLQAIFNNFVSGLILLFERSLKVGDFVELASGLHGTVRDIHIRATRISTNDNIGILVPNSEFVSGRVVNWTLSEAARRQKIPFGVAYGTDKERVKKAALEAAAAVPFTLCQDGPRAPQVWLSGFGESSLDFQLVVWLTPEATRRPGSVTAAYNWALHTALEKYGIEVPFPQPDLHVRSWPDSRPGATSPARPDTPIGLADNDAARDVQREIDESAASPSPTGDATAR